MQTWEARDAVLSELLAQCYGYALEVEALVGSRNLQEQAALEQYMAVSLRMDRMRDLCGTSPELNVQWAATLISHAELMRQLWRDSYAGDGGADGGFGLEEHLAVIDSLARACRRQLVRG